MGAVWIKGLFFQRTFTGTHVFIIFICFFSRMRSKGSRFTLGVCRSLAPNIDFEVVDFGVHEKTHRKASIL